MTYAPFSFSPFVIWSIALALSILLFLYRACVYEKNRKKNILEAQRLQMGKAWSFPTNDIEVNKRSVLLFTLLLVTGLGTFLSAVSLLIDFYLAR